MAFLIVVSALIVAAAPIHVRPIDPCPPPSEFPGRPYFDFQVTQPATYLANDTARIKPTEQRSMRPFPPDFALAQFVVDTLGVPATTTLKMLVTPTGLSKDDVASALAQWRYQAARVGDCKVPQVVQTPLQWK